MNLQSFLRRFARDERASVFAMVAVASIAVIGSVGLAVDVGRSQMVESKLQNAVDAAGLAAGANVSTTDINALATKYINLNFNQGTLGSTLGTVTSTVSQDNQVITLTANATVPTTFMKIFGQQQVNISATTEVTRSNKGLELAMVLDTTGSMDGTKITALKTAAHSMVSILFGTSATQDNLWIGMVPFSQTVNIGTAHSAWLDGSTFDWGPGTWKGCVDARYATSRDVNDDPPSVQRFRAYYWPDHNSYNNWIIQASSNTTTICSNQSSCRCTNYACGTTTSGNTTTTIACTGSGSSRSCTRRTDIAQHYDIDETGTSQRGPNAYCPAPTLPMTNVRATIDAAIDTIYPAGNTHINYGAVWGWRMLSPRWRGVWGGTMATNNLPLDYNTPLMNKAIIIMTDGTNTMSNGVRSAYGYLSEGNLGTTDAGTATTNLNTKLTTVCNAMKAQNIIVYTVLFQETNTTIRNLMRNCATTPDYFFDSPTEAELNTAFQTIGDSLANLRISR